MRPGALPLPQQVLLDLIAPPIVAAAWFVLSRVRAGAIRGGSVTASTKERQKLAFWALLCVGYLVMFGITIYGFLT